MLNIHRCSLPGKELYLKKLPPNASWAMRLKRTLRKLIIANPKNFRCRKFFNQSAIKAEQKRHISSPYYYIVHPFSTLCAAYEVAFTLIWMTKMLTDPVIQIAPPMHKSIEIIDCFVLPTMQFMLICSFFFVGYMDEEAGEVILEPKRVMRRYVKTFFLFDVVAAELFKLIVLFLAAVFGMNPNWTIIKIIHGFHLVCLYVRLGSVLDYLNDILRMCNLSRKTRRPVAYGVKTYMYVHLFTCMTYFVPMVVYDKKWPEDSWLALAKIDPSQNPSIATIYRECFLMTVCYFFGTSAGKYYIDQTNEQICFCFITFFGRLYTLFVLADALRTFGVVGMSEGNYESRFAQLKEFMKSNDLPSTLRNRMVVYYEHKQQKRYFDEDEILDSLSDNLKSELFLFSARKLIQKSQVFRYLPPKEIATLISLMRTETFAPGNVLFRPDHNCVDAYFISSGTVSIINREGLELCHLDDGDALGLIASMPGKSNYTVLILETTELFAIKITELNEFLRPYPEAAAYLNEMAKERMREYDKLESDAKMDATNCLVNLRTGKLLERKKRRMDS